MECLTTDRNLPHTPQGVALSREGVMMLVLQKMYDAGDLHVYTVLGRYRPDTLAAALPCPY